MVLDPDQEVLTAVPIMLVFAPSVAGCAAAAQAAASAE